MKSDGDKKYHLRGETMSQFINICITAWCFNCIDETKKINFRDR